MSSKPKTGVCVLIVEDSPDDQMLMTRSIRRRGLGVDICTIADGQKAIDYLETSLRSPAEERRPHVVVLDSVLPGRDGSEVLSWIRSQEPFKDLPVLKLVTRSSPFEFEESFRGGATACAEKSPEFSEVSDFIEGVLKTLSS